MRNVLPILPRSAVIADLLPTQVTVDMREVAFKRNRWRDKDRETGERYLNTHAIPVILGPAARHLIVDRHHLSRALPDEGVTEGPISVVADLSNFTRDEFWSALQSRNWSRPFDDKGDHCSHSDTVRADIIDRPNFR